MVKKNNKKECYKDNCQELNRVKKLHRHAQHNKKTTYKIMRTRMIINISNILKKSKKVKVFIIPLLQGKLKIK